MMQRDYILRLIEQLGQVWAILYTLVTKGKFAEALLVIDQALQRLVGFSLAEAEALSAEDLIELVRLGGSRLEESMIADQLTVIASLLREAAEVYAIQGDLDRADNQRLKALHIFLAALTGKGSPSSPHVVEAVEPLLDQLSAYELPAGVKNLLWQHFERVGQFAKAEDWLFELLEDDQVEPGTIERGIAFFERLLERSDAELIQGDLPRDEVLAGLAQLQTMQDEDATPGGSSSRTAE